MEQVHPILNHSYLTSDWRRSRTGFLPGQSGAKVTAFDGKFRSSQRLFCTAARNKPQYFGDYERFKWFLVCWKLLSRKGALDGNVDVLLTRVDSFWSLREPAAYPALSHGLVRGNKFQLSKSQR